MSKPSLDGLTQIADSTCWPRYFAHTNEKQTSRVLWHLAKR